VKRFAAIVAIALAADTFAAERLGLRQQLYELNVREALPLQVFGATAAWAVDPSIVDVATWNGTVTLTARAAGKTRVVVLTPAGEQILEVSVSAPRTAAKVTQPDHRNNASAEVRYASADGSIQNNITVRRETAKASTEVQVRSVHYGSEVTLPSVSYRIFTKQRELTFLDRAVESSPLTLDGAVLRGVHYLDEHWRIHAGVTTHAVYQSFLLPTDRETVLGVGYRTGALTSSLYLQPGQGAMLSLLYDYAPHDGISGRAELGIGRALGAAAELQVDRGRNRMRIDARYRPDELPSVRASGMSGLVADGSWSRSSAHGSYAAVALSATDRSFTATADSAWRVRETLSFLSGASYGTFENGRSKNERSGSVRSLTVPVGAQLDFSRGGLTALYRYARNSDSNRGGHGFRLAARASLRRLGINAYLDRQEQAPTLSLIFREQPELALALEQLGITATSPADIARALRENDELIALGYINGVTIDLAPVRTQAALELSFLGASAARHQIRARLLRNRIESVAAHVDTTIATLSYARALTAATDVFASYSYWRTERNGQDAQVQPFLEAGVRHRFDGLPSSAGGGAIRGTVFIDEDLDGISDGAGVANAEIELDGMQRTQTDAEGAFVFRGVGRGSHRVTARIPSGYFTTPSRVEASPGETIRFGIAWTPARLQGRITNDAGTGIAGVRIVVSRGATKHEGVTANDGSYSIVAPPGAWTMSLLADTVPAGYALGGLEARDVTLIRDQPRDEHVTVRANRSINGRAPANAEVVVQPLGKRVRADGQGRFTIRSLPAGELTLIAAAESRTVTLPPGPAALTVDLSAPAPEIRIVEAGERRDTMKWIVQIGAFRVRANALDVLQRARRTGVDAKLTEGPALSIVRAGPFATQQSAAEAAQRLEGAGLDAVVQPQR
jgi:hypothetical protein